jgi:hypothetical protein
MPQDFITLHGRIISEPKRVNPATGGRIRKVHKERSVIIDLPRDDLAAYYRTLIQRRYGIHLQAPIFGAHVTLVCGTEFNQIKDHEHLRMLHNMQVTLKVRPQDVYKAWQFWVLPVEDNGRLAEIRRSLGLLKPYRFHITVARDYEPQHYPAPLPEPVLPFSKLSFGG